MLSRLRVQQCGFKHVGLIMKAMMTEPSQAVLNAHEHMCALQRVYTPRELAQDGSWSGIHPMPLQTAHAEHSSHTKEASLLLCNLSSSAAHGNLPAWKRDSSCMTRSEVARSSICKSRIYLLLLREEAMSWPPNASESHMRSVREAMRKSDIHDLE